MSGKKLPKSITIAPGKRYDGLISAIQKKADEQDLSVNKYLLKLLSEAHGINSSKTKRQ